MGDAIHSIADALPVWRDAIVTALAGIVIAALYLYDALTSEP